MMTGAGQGGTAGGMKITTIAVLVIMVYFVLKQTNQEPHIFKRTIEREVINKAATIIMLSSGFVLFITLLLLETQDQSFIRILFEVVSAFCTVGVSVGDGGILSLSVLFDDFGKMAIISSMIAGRLGVFAFGLLLVGNAKKVHFKYPVGRIIV
jgi:trk system potassium uptake protein TrkH